MIARVGVVTFPGSCDDRDAMRALRLMGADPVSLWHRDADLRGVDGVVLPGGFAYGDYLRTGAIARLSPVMSAVRHFAEAGGPLLGICNGFQVLCEAGLLPGALARNSGLSFICRWVHVRAEEGLPGRSSLEPGDVLEIPIKHGEGRFIAPPEDLERMERMGLVAYRYCSAGGTVDPRYNPNGSAGNIAGVRNEAGNVMGIMPHPEHAVDPDLGPTGGQHIFQWLLSSARGSVPAAAGADWNP